MDAGIIGTTGRSVTIETDEGTKTLEEPEYIFTVSEWNKRGFRVNKGETHIAECLIWKKDKGGKKPMRKIRKIPKSPKRSRLKAMAGSPEDVTEDFILVKPISLRQVKFAK